MEYILGFIGIILIMVLMGSFVELGGVITKYFLQKRDIKRLRNQPVQYTERPDINRYILSFLHDYENNIESYTLEQDLHEIKLTIKLPPKEKDISIEEFIK